jgi:hypothetical protein
MEGQPRLEKDNMRRRTGSRPTISFAQSLSPVDTTGGKAMTDYEAMYKAETGTSVELENRAAYSNHKQFIIWLIQTADRYKAERDELVKIWNSNTVDKMDILMQAAINRIRSYNANKNK